MRAVVSSGAEARQERETARLEAFSDGIFAFAMTLLVLNLKDPSVAGQSLLQGLLGQWPAFIAFLTSFATILVLWMNHHNLFNYVRKIDRRFMLLNGIVLLFTTLTPFTTSLAAGHITSTDSNTAVAVYSGTFFLLAIAYNLLWWYASHNHRLLGTDVTEIQARTIARQYIVGPLGYSVCFLISIANGFAGLIACLAIMGWFGVTTSLVGSALQESSLIR